MNVWVFLCGEEKREGKMKKRKKRADGQKSGLAGELFAAAEPLKRELQVLITFGNAKAIDLFVYNENVEKSTTCR